jgi:hypothetical protein
MVPAALLASSPPLPSQATHLPLLHLHEQALQGGVAGNRCRVQARGIQARRHLVLHLVLLLLLLLRRIAGVDGLPLGRRLALQREAATPVLAAATTSRQAHYPTIPGLIDSTQQRTPVPPGYPSRSMAC